VAFKEKFMTRIFVWILTGALLAALISGFVPYRETTYGKSCDYSYTAGHTVCRQTESTWTRNGWLVQAITGYETAGTRNYNH
jgi:hypothetical protein